MAIPTAVQSKGTGAFLKANAPTMGVISIGVVLGLGLGKAFGYAGKLAGQGLKNATDYVKEHKAPVVGDKTGSGSPTV